MKALVQATSLYPPSIKISDLWPQSNRLYSPAVCSQIANPLQPTPLYNSLTPARPISSRQHSPLTSRHSSHTLVDRTPYLLNELMLYLRRRSQLMFDISVTYPPHPPHPPLLHIYATLYELHLPSSYHPIIPPLVPDYHGQLGHMALPQARTYRRRSSSAKTGTPTTPLSHGPAATPPTQFRSHTGHRRSSSVQLPANQTSVDVKQVPLPTIARPKVMAVLIPLHR